MSHRRKEKDLKKAAAETLIDSGLCLFKPGECEKNYDCENCGRTPGAGKDAHIHSNDRLFYRSIKKARDIKRTANFKDKPTSPPPPPPPPPPTQPESQKIS